MMNIKFKIFVFLLWMIINCQFSEGQTKENEWTNNLDSVTCEVSYKKKDISKAFLATKKWSRKNIASLDGNFKAGCTGKGKRTRLNWVLKDKKGCEIYSFFFGGRGFHTRYFVFYYVKITEIAISSKKRFINFLEFIQRIKVGDYTSIKRI